MKLKLNLLVAAFVFSFTATAQTPKNSKPAKKEGILNFTEALKDARMSLSGDLTAEDQWTTYGASLKTFCDSIQSPEAKAVKANYLTELLLLAAKMYEIDSGKRPTDCFASYYALNAQSIDEIMTTLPSKAENRLRTEIDNAKSAFGRQ